MTRQHQQVAQALTAGVQGVGHHLVRLQGILPPAAGDADQGAVLPARPLDEVVSTTAGLLLPFAAGVRRQREVVVGLVGLGGGFTRRASPGRIPHASPLLERVQVASVLPAAIRRDQLVTTVVSVPVVTTVVMRKVGSRKEVQQTLGKAANGEVAELLNASVSKCKSDSFRPSQKMQQTLRNIR